MVGLRKAQCYRRVERAYTRKSKFKSKGYIKAFPPHKISRFEMGDRKKEFPFKLKLVSKDTLQIRHNAIESARMVINKELETKLGTNYYLTVNIFPHHALRENRMLGGAHADRLQSGMAHSFGKVIGSAAQVKKGKILFTAFVNKEGIDVAKNALNSANPRLPGRCLVAVEAMKAPRISK